MTDLEGAILVLVGFVGIIMLAIVEIDLYNIRNNNRRIK